LIIEGNNVIGNGIVLGTGEGNDYADGRLDRLTERDGVEVKLYRAVSEAESISIISNNYSFVPYEFAIEKKWFATCLTHAEKWAEWFYTDGVYRIIEIVVLRESLKYMFYLKMLDNIGPAYAADINLLSKIVREVKII